MIFNVTDSVVYIGENDHDVDLFEGQYIVPNGMAYNSYLILDGKTAVLDTIDASKTEQWLGNIEKALEGRTPDYLIIQHMEPDHAGSIEAFVNKYPDACVISNDKATKMLGQFFPELKVKNLKNVKDGETLELGNHTLTFVAAPMVHWPEVMMVYDSADKILFSADGFGKFGALDADEDWACEARRYYFGIVGKYGKQVQAVLKKAAGLDIAIICPLHGPVLTENLGYYLNLYDIWSSYGVETPGIMIFYTSVYGHTKEAAELLEQELADLGVPKVECADLARTDMAEDVEDAFRHDTVVLATTTYNAGMFPFMAQFIDELLERDFQNRRVAFIENGTWAPAAAKRMKAAFENAKNITFAENTVTIKSALNDESRSAIKALAAELAAAYK